MVVADGHIVVNYMLFRNKPFETKGRYQSEEESDMIAGALLTYVTERGFYVPKLPGHDHERVEAILKNLNIE